MSTASGSQHNSLTRITNQTAFNYLNNSGSTAEHSNPFSLAKAQ